MFFAYINIGKHLVIYLCHKVCIITKTTFNILHSITEMATIFAKLKIYNVSY